MRKTITFLFIFLLSGLSMAFAQDVTIKGNVSDKTGAPLPGVSVIQKGTQIGTQTDFNGNYSITIKANATLVFSYVGFAPKEVAVKNSDKINVTLEDNTTGLNEVVVIGYGTQKKASVTGAISSVSADDLKDQQVTRVDDALEGRAAGVLVTQSSGAPGSQPNILIRGQNSLTNSYPLYVIDGQIWDNGGYDAINPNDIESIQVLKDASAAIYGSRASDGVILITTKKGAIGTPKINYNFYYGTQSVTKKVELADASQYAQLSDQAAINDGGTAPFANPSQYGTGTDWQNEIFGKAPIMQQNLSVSGGTDKSNYYTSLGYLDQQGIVTPSESDYKRMNFRVNTSSKPKKWLTYGENFEYTYTRSTTNFNTNSVFGGPISDALNLDPITPVIVTNVNAQPNAATVYNNPNYAPYLLRNAQGQPYGVSPYVANEIVNPIAAEQLQTGNYNWSHNLFGDAYLQVEPIKGLTIKTEIAAKQAFYGSESFAPLYYLNANTFNLPPATNNQSRSISQNLEWNWDNTATYTRSIGKHNFTVLVGQSAEQESGYGVGDTNFGEPISSYQDASFNYALPNTSRIGYGTDNQPETLSSFFGRISYDYDQKYLIQGIVRRDGSSKFGSDNVYGTFPSISAGWVASKEDWFPKNSFVDYLKLRASYGILGNELALNPFQYTPIVGSIGSYAFGNGSQTLYTGYGPNSLPNPSLEWERDKSTDIALDATLFHDLTLTVDYYNKASDQLLLSVSPPSYAVVSGSAFENAGGIDNKGFEIQLGYNKKIGDFGVNLNGNISHNKNNVTNLSTLAYIPAGAWQGSNTPQIQRSQVGQPFDSFYGYQVTGIFQSQAQVNAYKTASGSLIQPNAKPGDYIYADPDGQPIGPGDREFLGSPIPTWNYGFNFAANYKQWDVSVFGQGVWGNKVLQEYRRLDLSSANYPVSALDAWSPTNTNTNIPRLTNTDPNGNYHNLSSALLESGAYMRIKTIQLGYTLPKSLMSKWDMSRVHVYVSGDNLFTITKYTGYDPEVWGGSNQVGGVDQGVYPTARTLRVGVDVTL
jgi:TonB-linked SusC/RagA family outer membrane protein